MICFRPSCRKRRLLAASFPSSRLPTYALFIDIQVAAKENARYTPHCEPTFTRLELEQRRDEENCFRYTELAIPRGTPVTILARPMVAQAGTGEGADCNIRLVSPGCDEGLEPPLDAKNLKDRFRFRILKGHQVGELVREKGQWKVVESSGSVR